MKKKGASISNPNYAKDEQIISDLVTFCGENPAHFGSDIEQDTSVSIYRVKKDGASPLNAVVYDDKMELVSQVPPLLKDILSKAHPQTDWDDPKNLSADVMYMHFPRQVKVYRKQHLLADKSNEPNFAIFRHEGSMWHSYMVPMDNGNLPRDYIRCGVNAGMGSKGLERLFFHVIARHSKFQVKVGDVSIEGILQEVMV